MSNIFNVAALFVLLRESLEAALIVGVLLNYIKKTVSHDPVKARKLKAAVWWGSGAGLAISIVIGVVFTVIFYVLKNDVFDGAGVGISWVRCRICVELTLFSLHSCSFVASLRGFPTTLLLTFRRCGRACSRRSPLSF